MGSKYSTRIMGPKKKDNNDDDLMVITAFFKLQQ